MPRTFQLLLLFTTLITLSLAEDWFMPDSNLISDAEFKSKVVDDRLSYKFVKYFTPHCPYCRYLKAVMDALKHKKEWCFKVYDFNCQWYPQFCMNNVKSGSFPYTAIYDEHGNTVEEIHGFYPEPIISTIFDRIEERCLAARGQGAPIAAEGGSVVQQAIAHHQANARSNVQPATVAPIQFHQQPKAGLQQQPAQQKKNDIKQHSQSKSVEHAEVNNGGRVKAQQSKVQQQHAAQQIDQQPTKKQMEMAKQAERHTPNEKEVKNGEHNQVGPAISFHSYLFYGVCLVCAAYYVYSLHADKPNPEMPQSSSPKTAVHVEQKTPTVQKQNKQGDIQPSMQQSELLKQIPDEQL